MEHRINLSNSCEATCGLSFRAVRYFADIFSKENEVSLSLEGKQPTVFGDDDTFKLASEFRILENLCV